MVLTPELAVVWAILLCLCGAVLTGFAAASRKAAGWLGLLVTLGSGALVIFAVAEALAGRVSPSPPQFLRMPALGFALRLHVDGLSAVYLALAVLVAIPAALYSISYMEHYQEYTVRRYYPYFLAFLAAMYGLLTTTDMMWFFFIFWQMMTLPGYALIRYEYRVAENVRAANRYLIMMQIACAATMVGAELLAVGGATIAGGGGLKYDFESVRANLPAMLQTKPVLAGVAFGLFLVGFGMKMGMWPFGQFWLPDAHPAAPSPVSAMLSGVMIKTGAYGLMRYFLWLPSAEMQAAFPMSMWGWVVVILGTITLFTGTMQALSQEQSKRLLAFHSIGQIGYVMLGTGACMLLLPKGSETGLVLASIGLCGALFHVLNHGLFKALLFLNAGSLLWATGTQNLNMLGGLARLMPITAASACVASLSIAGVPLFNGFASKWHIYIACLNGSGLVPWLAVCGLVAILTSALTLASFMKFFGASFLSRSSKLVRDRLGGRDQLEVTRLMQFPQVFLALVCVLLGVWPALGTNLISCALRTSHHGWGDQLAGAMATNTAGWWGITLAGGAARFAPLGIGVILALGVLIAVWISRLGGAKRRAAEPWLCGYATENEHNRYSAHGYYWEVKRLFGWLGGIQQNRRLARGGIRPDRNDAHGKAS